MKTSKTAETTAPETSPEYDRFKALLGKVLAVPHEEIVRREAEYQKERALQPKRGPRKKKKV
ncbi:MAG TPA: hypothetical protein VN519_03680 [Bryobacteraceae bacterium]|nr:hypothetical protein [Bryobacteraceae bacterium]